MKRTHGDTTSRLYSIWAGMKSRCFNPNIHSYKHYGGRGITVCDEWKNSYIDFKKWALENGYDESLTLDRIDVNGNYEPSNCRWATQKQQARNTRFNNIIELNGESHCISEWAEILGIGNGLILHRVKRGLPPEEILRTDNIESHPPINITFNGQTKNISQWAKETGIPESALRSRLTKGKGFSVEEALTLPSKAKFRDLNITYNGETHHLKEWGEILGISYDTLRKRLFTLNMTIEEAFTKPVMTRKYFNTVFRFNGEEKTLGEWSKYLDIPYDVLTHRLFDLNQPVERAFTEDVHTRNHHNDVISYNGEEKTLDEWAKMLGIKYEILRERIFNYGWSIEKAFSTQPKPRLIEFNGQSKDLNGWAEYLNIPLSVLYDRIYVRKWAVEKAFNQPVRKRKA